MIWRSDNGGDLFETNSNPETVYWGNTNAMFYLFKNQKSGTSPIYRLSDGIEHMVSVTTSENGFTLEGLLGYAYTSSQTGMMELVRKYNSSIPDHALSHDSETLSGYSDERMSRWGYRRYGTSLTNLLSLSAGGVTIESNLQAGGSVWTWTWNGVQFINDADYGRQLQTSMFIHNSAWWASKATGTASYANPTEAGSNNADQYGPLSQGSPILSASNSGNTQTTRCRPLDFNSDEFSPVGGSYEHPILYSDMVLGKDITLNFANLGAVAKYTTYLDLPDTISHTNNVIEIPGIYLRPMFTRYYTYDASSNTLTEITGFSGDDTAFMPSSGYGGAIMATSDENTAFGIYAVTTAQGGSMNSDGFRMWKGDSTGGGQYDGGWRKINVTHHDDTWSSGVHTYNAYLISGTLSDVRSKMQSLYSGSYK